MTVKAAALLASAAALLAACGPSVVADAKRQVAQGLSDPASAQFRDVAAHGDAVCGEVNAKNPLGGYGGFHPFIVYGRAVLTPPEETGDYALDFNMRESFHSQWARMCDRPYP